jgi:hypothetical protein
MRFTKKSPPKLNWTKPEKKGTVGFSLLEYHPLHAQCVGRIAAIFSAVEVIMCQMFCWAIHCAPHHGAAAFYKLVNNKARRDMVMSLGGVLHTDEERNAFRSLVEKIDQCATIRNRYCHALWQTTNGKLYRTEGLEIRYPLGTKIPVSVEMITDEMNTCVRLLDEIRVGLISLTHNRPLVVSKDAIKPSFAQKFLKPQRDRSQPTDPTPPSSSGDSQPQTESSEE